MSRPYVVEIDTRAAREIRALPKQEQRRIIEKIEALAEHPRPSGCVKLSGESSLWRVRAGTYRILYQIQDHRLLVTVVKVGHRRDIYKNL